MTDTRSTLARIVPPFHPLVVGFLKLGVHYSDSADISGDNLAEGDKAAVKDFVGTGAPCFRTLNGQYVWKEHLAGWKRETTFQQEPAVKREYDIKEPTSGEATPKQRFSRLSTSLEMACCGVPVSDVAFLQHLSELTAKEQEAAGGVLDLAALQRLEEGLNVTHFSSTKGEGKFLDVRVVIRFEAAQFLLLGANQQHGLNLFHLLEMDSTPNCLRRIEEPHLLAKIDFLIKQPCLWIQFAKAHKLLPFQRQRFLLLVFPNYEDRSLLERLYPLVMNTSYQKMRKKYLRSKNRSRR